MGKVLIAVFLIVVFSAFVGSQSNSVIIKNIVGPSQIIINQSSTNFWDSLDVPTDIPNSQFWYNFSLTPGDGGLKTDQDDELNTTGSPLFEGLNITNSSGTIGLHVSPDGLVGLNTLLADMFDTLTITGTMDLIHTATIADDHAFEIITNAAGFGDVKAIDINYVTGAIELGEDEGVILINVDQSAAIGGDVFGLEVLTTQGRTNISGLKVGVLINPIHHDSGVFGNMDSAKVLGVDRLSEFISSASDIAIFVANSDDVIIGDANKFEEISFLFNTVASGAGIKPTFEFSTGSDAWTTFTPIDGTNGMKNNGVIAYEAGDIPTWVTGNGTEFLIRITRTQNVLSTNPIEDIVQISAVTEYFWYENGNVSLNSGDFAQNVSASFFKGDGSELTGIAGGIWENVSGTATYTDRVNITGNVSINSPGESAAPLFIRASAPSINPVAIRLRENAGAGEYMDIEVDSSGNLAFRSDAGELKLTISDSAGSVAISQDLGHIGDIGTDIEFTSDTIKFTAGSRLILSLIEDTQIVAIFNDDSRDIDFRIESDNKTHAFFFNGANGFVGINQSIPSFPLEVWGSSTDSVSIWSDGNVSAQGYITRTSVYDSEKGSVWGWIRNATDYITDEKIIHERFYGAVTYQKIDTSRPVNISITEEECNTIEDIEICQNATGTKIEYPFKMDESGVELGKEIDVLRQAVFELKQENDLMKVELCIFQPLYNWC